MIAAFALVATLVVAGLPPLVGGAPVTAIAGPLAGLLCMLALALHSVRLLQGGAMLALANFTAALWQSAAPVMLAVATGFGVALLILIGAAAFIFQFNGAQVGRAVLRGQVRYWCGCIAAAAIAVVVLGAAASVIASAIPAEARPIAAAVGALVMFAALCAGAGRDSRGSRGDER